VQPTVIAIGMALRRACLIHRILRMGLLPQHGVSGAAVTFIP